MRRTHSRSPAGCCPRRGSWRRGSCGSPWPSCAGAGVLPSRLAGAAAWWPLGRRPQPWRGARLLNPAVPRLPPATRANRKPCQCGGVSGAGAKNARLHPETLRSGGEGRGGAGLGRVRRPRVPVPTLAPAPTRLLPPGPALPPGPGPPGCRRARLERGPPFFIWRQNPSPSGKWVTGGQGS